MRIRDFNPPPTYSDLFYRWIGIPRSTGLDIYVGDYPYGVGLSAGKRMRYRFPSRQGLAGKLITAAQTIQRQHFRAALDVYDAQPTYTAFAAPYGQHGRNLWFNQASGFGWFTINYFMSLELDAQRAECPSPWDTSRWLTIYAGQVGDVYNIIDTLWLKPGTYRVELLKTNWETLDVAHPFLFALTVYRRYLHQSWTLQNLIGVTHPSGFYIYCHPDFMYDSIDDAWDGLHNDAERSFLDVTLTEEGELGIQFWNDYMQSHLHKGFLTAKITKVS